MCREFEANMATIGRGGVVASDIVVAIRASRGTVGVFVGFVVDAIVVAACCRRGNVVIGAGE